jgi:SNF2 family DNA or RNA helicase
MPLEYRSDDNFVYIKGTPFTMKEEIQNTLNGVWVKSGYRFPKNVHSMRELLKFFPDIKYIPEFITEGKEQAAVMDGIHSMKGNPTPIEGLRPYQAQDVHFLRAKGSALVLNEPRTGKTPTVIKTLIALEPKTVIIIAPSSLTYNWSKEFEKWANDMFHITVYSGTPKEREKLWAAHKRKNHPHKVLIISKDTLKKDKEIQDMGFTVCVVDEAHYLRNYKTAQSKAVLNITAKIKYALTGTPAVKHGSDVYGLLHFVDPKAFPSYWQFAARYWIIDDGHWGKTVEGTKTHRQAELLHVMETLSVQRKRKDVMQWLPPVNNEKLLVTMDKKQLKLYDQMYETFTAGEEEEVDAMNSLVQLMRLRQLCLDPRLLGFDVVGSKTEALLEFAENNPDPFIVMTTFSSYFALIKPALEKLGKKVGIIDGSISQKEKFKTAEDFQNGGFDILLCNIIAAGTGFTLDRADTILFLDKDFSPANNEQAQDRIVPTTEARFHNINIISLVVAGSIDERVNDILDRKEDLTKIINKRELFV